MAGRPGAADAGRFDPKSGRRLPEGIRWREDRQRYQIRFISQTPDGPAERTATFRLLSEAKLELARLVAGRNPNGAMTLTRWHEEYWKVIEASVRPSTQRCYDVGWRLRVKPWLGTKRLDEITSPIIETAMVKWTGGASAKNDALAVLSRLLDGARRARIIDYNPAREVKRPSMRESISPTSRALTVRQVEQLLDAISDGVYRRYAAALCFTGMRAGEVTALRVRDVDTNRGIIHVARSLSPGRNGELVEQSPKSHKEREVPLTELLRPHLDEALRGKGPDDLVFDGPDGGRLTNHNFTRAVRWQKLRVALGRPDLRVHDLRHTFATILFDAGASAPDVQATPGHSSLQVTERYSRAREGVALRAGSALQRAFEPEPRGTAQKTWKPRTTAQPARVNGTEMAHLTKRREGSGTRTRKTPDPPAF